ncbi:MAG: hypothetical protein PHT88_02135 [Candidatus Moranbacteria bacterium]|nr:hypothetical protein [Candidatus Moranbacteria bacterium]
MKKTFLKKRSVVIAGLITVFLITGFLYAKKSSNVFSSDKPRLAEAMTDVPKTTQTPLEAVVAEEPEKQEVAQSQAGNATEIASKETSDDKPIAKPVDQGLQGDVVSAAESVANKLTPSSMPASNHPVHKNITTTIFWAGEEAGKDNKNISNLPSAWDEEWVRHFGGVDAPGKRSGYMPSGFTPKENPFYFALPYNDFDEDGNRKQEVSRVVAWAGKRAWKDNESMLKNQWIKITKNGKVAYAQWQDVGPFKEDDVNYVFGTATPKSKINNHAGLDVSPAVKDMLGLSDIDTVDWQFVNPDEVPAGPWKTIVTTSQINWK